ncbi:uncharacterized protein LOC129769425 [Toxorhynchites rutilus septentrionalis]|uniref:uncharacterized protein LOC129769425 n=1 Tax=Toxorhynchites rutilus septentrionalis TaxID=329112 RepID=UPI00247AE3F5|nr:uncharacterized protein LOC129769425 [Toxorhynchites rutilus septentrionalis]
MLRFVSTIAILIATAKAAPVDPVHFSIVAQHPHADAVHHTLPEVQHHPIYLVEAHENHQLALPQQHIVASSHELLGHQQGLKNYHGDHSSLYGGENHGHLYDTGYHGEYAKTYHDYYAYPKYSFEYGVDDPHTGDHKKQWETRDGDVVKGGYMFKEADGTTRVVEYTSDDHNGFNAVVKNIGHAHHPEVQAHQQQHNHVGHLSAYAGAYATGDYYGKGASSYSKIWKQE